MSAGEPVDQAQTAVLEGLDGQRDDSMAPAPGGCKARLVTDATQALTIELAGGETGVTSRLIVPDPAVEYRFGPPDEALLKSLAAATGGSWMPTPAALQNAARSHQADRRPLWPALVIFALILWLGDLLLRRIRVFEPQGGQPRH